MAKKPGADLPTASSGTKKFDVKCLIMLERADDPRDETLVAQQVAILSSHVRDELKPRENDKALKALFSSGLVLS